MKYLFTFILISSFLLVKAQTSTEKGNLPMIIPPSPEVAELARLGQLGSGNFTGASNVNIPLYTLKTGPINVPLSLAYSNNGIKVGDIPSRVGLGWSLASGGSVSRVVRDEVDGVGTTLTPPSNFAAVDATVANYLDLANKYGYNTESDMFYFNAPGISGKFYFDGSGNPHIEENNNCKITRIGTGNSINTFIITNPEGLKYYFGESGVSERTRKVNVNMSRPPVENNQTAWFLTSIVSPEGHSITFDYLPIIIVTQQGQSQTVKLEHRSGSPNIICGSCQGSFPVPGTNSIEYETYYLSSIQTSNEFFVDFSYQDRPDAGGDNRLATINIKGLGKPIHKYRFEYIDDGQSSLNAKFYLNKIYLESGSLPQGNQQILLNTFEYIAGMPHQNSLAQDYYGYYNGVTNTNFAPRILSYQNYINASQLADRTPNANTAQAGALKKVTFSTGGYDEYFYEGHTMNFVEQETQWNNFHMVGTGTGFNTWVEHRKNFSPTQNQTIAVIFNLSKSPGAPLPGSPNYYEIDGAHRIAELEFWNMTTNERLFYERTYSNIASVNLNFIVTAENTYQFRFKISGSTPQGVVDFKYDPVIVNIPKNKLGCGIRVAGIRSYDPVSGQLNEKYFKYASVLNPEKSSGVGLLGFATAESGLIGNWCYGQGISGVWGFALNLCESSLVVSSSSMSPGVGFNGSNMAYKYIIESNTPDLSNGFIEHEYHVAGTSGRPAILLNHPMVNDPGSEGPSLNGKERMTTVYKMVDSVPVMVSATLNYWGFGYDYSINNIAIRKNWDPYPGDTDPTRKVMGYDVGSYNYSSGWIRLDSTMVYNYDDLGSASVAQVTKHTYNTTYPTMIAKTDTWGSDRINKTTELSYSFNKTGTVYSGMVNSNIISPVIEQREKKNGNLISTVSNNYKNWSSTASNYKPDSIQMSLGNNPLETRIKYTAYDNLGNVKEVNKKNGPKVSYLWGYGGSSPVAESKNAGVSEIMAENFEESSSATLGIAHTGEYYYTGAYTVNWTRPNTRSYVISYWYRQNGVWKFKEVNYTTNSHACTGGDAYDDIRIHPVDAEMTTYTYRHGVGITSSIDARNLTTSYEYDDFQRLKYVKDQNGNIIKSYDYHYKS